MKIIDIKRSHFLLVFQFLVTDFDICCTDHNGLGYVIVQYFVNKIDGGSFSIRSCYTDYEKISRRVAIEIVGYLSVESLPYLVDNTIFEQEIYLVVEGNFFDK